MRVVFGLALSVAALHGSAVAEVPVFSLEDNMDQAVSVFKAFLKSSLDHYTIEEFAATAGDDVTVPLVFTRDDADSDGFVTFDEFTRWFTQGNLFLQLDGAVDGTKDGLVSREEFLIGWHGMPVNVFESDDVNGDDFISYDEFTGPKGSDSPQVNVFAQLDVDRNGKITKEEFAVEWHQVDVAVFDREDVDSDNVISYDEFMGPKGSSLEEALAATVSIPSNNQQPEGATNLFAGLDADMDGKVSHEEFHVEWHNIPNENTFVSEDVNEDGFLSWGEFNGPKGDVDPADTLLRNLFIILDQDESGVIEREEFKLNKGKLSDEDIGEMFIAEDANGDNVIEWDEFSGPKGERPPIYNVFAFLDTNSDNILSLEEFMVEENVIGNEKQFATEDRNSDGEISFEEFGGPKGEGRVADVETPPPREL